MDVGIYSNRITNARIREAVNVGEVSKKPQEARLRWYGHMLRREDGMLRRIMNVEVPKQAGRID